MDPADVNEGSLNEPLLITVMDDVLMVSLMVSVLCSTKDASGGDGHSATLHSSSEEKTEKGWGESRQRDTWTQLVYVESCSLHGTFHQKPFNIATWNTWWMGVGKRTRVITGEVGGIESCGSGVCVAGISSCFAVSCESLRTYRRMSPPFSTHGLFIGVNEQAHRMNLQKGLILPASTACMPLTVLPIKLKMPKLT